MFDRPAAPKEILVEQMSRVVCSLFASGMKGRAITSGFWKISIRLNSKDQSEDGAILLGVLVINRAFPVERFLDSSLQSKQQMMLSFITEAVQDVFQRFGLEEELIKDAVRNVLEHDFRNLFRGRRIFKNEGTGVTARIECEQEMEVARIFVEIRRSRSRERILVTACEPDEFLIQRYFGSVEWSDLGEPALRLVDGSFISLRGTLSKE
jgi:hypothetical protein